MADETVKEVPLSLQVFHSHNEYKAHRRNRTEQIHLKDLEDVIVREEKLYVKEYAFQRSSFHRHYARRFSAPLLSANSFGGCSSRATTAPSQLAVPRRSVAGTSDGGGGGGRSVSRGTPRTSVFSVGASMRHVEAINSPMATRMLEGLKTVSVSSRFQRIQRRLSLASMTENGRLTAKGDLFAKDIQKARQHLFNKDPAGKGCGNDTNERSSGPGRMESTMGAVLEEDQDECDDNILQQMELAQHVQETKHGKEMINVTNLVTPRPSVQVEDKAYKQADTNVETSGSSSAPHVTILGVNEKDKNDKNVNPMNERKTKISRMRGFSPARDNAQVKVHQEALDRELVIKELDGDLSNQPQETDNVSPENQTFHENYLSQQTSDIFKRMLSQTAHTEPLRTKIEAFLQDQNRFNSRFPKGPEGSFVKSARHQELLEKEKDKQEQLQVERKKKKVIIFEVLNKLDIKDEHVLFHYDQ